ncbi:S-adenosyl-L-methionine-dependent methyltransferase [Pisolithus microcarpus]|nr:S-adenosyl-L-methionine-dependent methyltransferase [Pisolithus microcarpus]
MPSPSVWHVSQLSKKLASLLGRESASLELKWMRQSLKPSGPNSSQLRQMLERRLAGGTTSIHPGYVVTARGLVRQLAQISKSIGTTPFGPLSLLSRPPILIPRPETEDWTLRLANTISPKSSRPLSVLDLGSTLAFGVDISEQAIELATDNAARCNIPTRSGADALRNVFVPVLGDLRDTNLLKELEAPFDVVTANPPYVPMQEYVRLPPSVKDYEDPRALLGDMPESPTQNAGLSFYHIIARFLAQKDLLRDGAIVALEVGDRQAGDVEKILHCSAGLRNTEIWTDPWGKQRVVLAHA